jgi:hypothetical protein
MTRLASVLILSLVMVAGCTVATSPGSPPASPSAEPVATSTAPSSFEGSQGPLETPSAADISGAIAVVDGYTQQLVLGNWAAAFAALAPSSQAHWGSLAAFTSERSAFFKSVAGRYHVLVPSPDAEGSISNWLALTYGDPIDLSHAVLVEVDYPALAGNNAGFNLYIVARTLAGSVIYDVR